MDLKGIYFVVYSNCVSTDESTEFLGNRLGRKYADGADGPIVHFLDSSGRKNV